MSDDGVTWWGDCDCGWTSKSYRVERFADRALAKHLAEYPYTHRGVVSWLLPGERLEEENVNG